jgi:hypothetical protein
VTTQRYWDLDDGRSRAQFLRSIIDELHFAAAASAIERTLRHSDVDPYDDDTVDRLLISLVEHSDLTYGARGWTALERAIRAGQQREPAADRLTDEAITILSAHPDTTVTLRYPGAMLEAALWQAAIRQRCGPSAGALEPLATAAELIEASGARHLSMRLAYRDVAVRLDVDSEPMRALDGLDRWDVDPKWDSRAWWHLARALTTIWTDGEPGDALADLDEASEAFNSDEAIGTSQQVLGLAAQLCAIVVAATDSHSLGSLRERSDRLLDTALIVRSEEPIGILTAALGSVTELILATVCWLDDDRELASVSLRAIDESRRAGIESVLLRSVETQDAARQQFASLAERFRDAVAPSSPFGPLADREFFPRETTSEVRSDAASRFPRFVELSAPSPLPVESIRAALDDRLLLLYSELAAFDASVMRYVVGCAADLDFVQIVDLDDEDVWFLNNLAMEDRSWADWWVSIAGKVLPRAALSHLASTASDEPLELVVVPDGVFQRMAWAALRPTATKRLIDLAIINVLPSARLVSSATVPDPAYAGAVASWAGTTVGEKLQRQGWDRLGWASASEAIETASDLFDRFGSGAHHEVFWLHLSGHGHDHENGLRQSIDLPQGKRLLALDALTLSWPPVVSMSACHVLTPGEIHEASDGQSELFGLALACLIGGASEVLGGLAAVESNTTDRIIKDIFERAPEPASVHLPALLRDCQLAYLKDADRGPVRPCARDWALLQAISRWRSRR